MRVSVVLAALVLAAPWAAHGLAMIDAQNPGGQDSDSPLFSRPAGAQRGELEVPDEGALPISETPRPGECPETLFEDTPLLDKEERSYTFPDSAGAHSIRFSFGRCVYEPDGRGRLHVYLTKSDAGRETTWQLFENDLFGDGVVEIGYSRFPEGDGERIGQGLPAVVEVAHVPGLFTLVFQRQEVDREGYSWILEEWLLDLRSGTPRAVAKARWEHSPERSERAADADDFSCSWMQEQKDFQCEERRGGLSRRLWLLSGGAINASLEGTEPLETGKPGALVYVPGIGRTRLIASLGPASRLVGPPFELVQRTSLGWLRHGFEGSRPKLGWFEATDAPSLREKEIHPLGRDRTWDRMWEVESGDEHYLVAMPGPHSLRVGLRMSLEFDASSQMIGFDQEPLAISRRGDAFEALVQPPARMGGNLDLTFNVDGRRESDKACAYTADLTFEPRKGFTLTPRPTKGACETSDASAGPETPVRAHGRPLRRGDRPRRVGILLLRRGLQFQRAGACYDGPPGRRAGRSLVGGPGSLAPEGHRGPASEGPELVAVGSHQIGPVCVKGCVGGSVRSGSSRRHGRRRSEVARLVAGGPPYDRARRATRARPRCSGSAVVTPDRLESRPGRASSLA